MNNNNNPETNEPSRKETSALKAIRQQCLICVGCADMVKTCTEKNKCSLWPYRLGTNPNHKKRLSEEQRQVLRERLKRLHEMKLIRNHTPKAKN